MLLRRWLTIITPLLTCVGQAQLSPAERKGFDDIFALGNLNRESFRPASQGPQTGLHAQFISDPIRALDDVLSWKSESVLNRIVELAGIEPSNTQTGVDPIDPVVPDPLRVPLGKLLAALSYANDEVRAATANLTPDQRRDLIETLPRQGLHDPSISLDFVKRPPLSDQTARDLVAKVDMPRILRAGWNLNQAIEKAASDLRSVRLEMPPLRFLHRGMPVLISGTADDKHTDRDAMLVVDLGGNDRYEGRFGAGIGYAAICLDLAGDDTYVLGGANLGCGLLGIGIALDVSGDDQYQCANLTLGCGVGGFGFFQDRKGHDTFRMGSGGLGFAAQGLGLFRDQEGRDIYEADSAAMGAGSFSGIGCLIDSAGNDMYRATRFAQGAAIRGHGLLADADGDDIYHVDEQGQGYAEAGLGQLIDFSGADHYTGVSQVQAVGAESGAGCLIDHSGDDSYAARTASSLALAGDGSLAVLVDRAGSDSYVSRGGRPGTAMLGGVALFVDTLGDDQYNAPAACQLGGLSVFIDLGGADEYQRDLSDTTAWLALGTLRLDASGSRPNPVPPDVTEMTQTPPASEMSKAFDQAISGGSKGDDAAAYLRRIGLPAFEWGLSNRLSGAPRASAILALIGSSLPTARERTAALAVGGKPGSLYLCVGIDAKPTAKAVLSFIEREVTRTEGIEAAGYFKVVEAVPLLLPLAASANSREALLSAVALSAIALPETFSTAEALLSSRDAKVRHVAIGWCAKHPVEAHAAADRLTKSPDEQAVRNGIALLSRLGTKAANQMITALLEDRRPGVRIEALSALDGRVPEASRAVVARLANDTNPLVRAVAKRVRLTGG